MEKMKQYSKVYFLHMSKLKILHNLGFVINYLCTLFTLGNRDGTYALGKI